MNEQKPQRDLVINDIATDSSIMRKRCEVLVIAMVGKELAEKWWTGSNRAFNGATPEQIYSVTPSVVYAYLMKSAEGEW